MEGETEGQESTENLTETATTEDAVATEETIVEETGKPGGDGPQAVRARKEYQARKAAEAKLTEQNLALAAAQERAKVLEEQLKAPKAETVKVFTPQEIQCPDFGQKNQFSFLQFGHAPRKIDH